MLFFYSLSVGTEINVIRNNCDLLDHTPGSSVFSVEVRQVSRGRSDTSVTRDRRGVSNTARRLGRSYKTDGTRMDTEAEVPQCMLQTNAG